MTCGLTPDEYLRFSSIKYDLARYHFAQFQRSLSDPSLMAFVLATKSRGGANSMLANSDGCVFQLFAAFDAFACSAAHGFGLPGADRVHFKNLHKGLTSTPQQARVGEVLREVSESIEFRHLEELRNRAGHRAVVVRRLGMDADQAKGYVMEQGEATEALPLLQELLSWAGPPLHRLWGLVEEWGP
jgi:hypothetical protein